MGYDPSMQTPSLICSACARPHAINASIWRCDCGGVLDLDYKPVIDLDAIRTGPETLWRYRAAIPLPTGSPILSMDEGFTPLLPIEIDGRSILIKQDHLFPTGSYKDRGASVLMSLAAGLGVSELIEDSSGNAGAAIAAYAELAGIKARIFVPEHQRIQTEVHHRDRGTDSTGFPATAKPPQKRPEAPPKTCSTPAIAGTHSFSRAPRPLPMRYANNSAGRRPTPLSSGRQRFPAARCSHRFRRASHGWNHLRCPPDRRRPGGRLRPPGPSLCRRLGTPVTSQPSKTMAEGIAIAEPTRGRQILKAVRVSGGRCLTVTEEAISEALADMAERGFVSNPPRRRPWLA